MVAVGVGAWSRERETQECQAVNCMERENQHLGLNKIGKGNPIKTVF